MMDLLYSVLSFVVAIGVLVTVHEFGHYWVARRTGVKVLRFSVGFGRPLWTWRGGADRIEYQIAAIPLGGYVKMLDEREGEVDPREVHRAFNRQRLPVRFAVVLAGPLFNFLFAIVAYWLMYVIGVAGLKAAVGEVSPESIAARAGLDAGQEIVSVGGAETRTWQGVIQAVMGHALDGDPVDLRVREGGVERGLSLDLAGVSVDDLARGRFFETLGLEPLRPSLPPVIGMVEAGGAAERAGLRPGDRVLSADGEPIPDWTAWVEAVQRRPDQVLTVTVERAGQPAALELRPVATETEDGVIGRIGAGVAQAEATLDRFYVTERYGPLESVGKGLARTAEVSGLTLHMFWKMLMLEVSVENISGPISIAQYAGYSAQIGLSRFLEFLALVSVSLGILNLLPIPLLDGGHLMYYLIELLKGGPVSEAAQIVGQRLGIAVLFGLMGLAFYNDLARLLG